MPVPYWLAILAVRLGFATIFRRATKVPAILTPRRLEAMLKPLRFENRRLRQTLGWTPPLDYQQCLLRTYGPAVAISERSQLTSGADLVENHREAQITEKLNP